jgi:hypothetical protein
MNCRKGYAMASFPWTRALGAIFFFVQVACVSALAACGVDTVVVRGRVEHVPANAKVHVQLVYAKNQGGDSAETTLPEGGEFNIPIESLTQSRRPVINQLFEKCERKPQAVIITLMGGEPLREYDRVALDFVKDFKISDSSSYALRSEVVLNGVP